MKDNLAKEALKRSLLLMSYDTSKTLTENTSTTKKILKEDQDTAQRNLLAKCDSSDASLDKATLFMTNNEHIDSAGLFNAAFASALGTDNEKWRQALKLMGDKGGFGDLCIIREKYKEQAGESLEDGIDADIDFDSEYAEFITAFQKMIERTKNTGLKTKEAGSQNIDAWETKYPCVFMSLANTDKKINKDVNNYTYIIIKGNSGSQYKLFFDGRIKTMDEKATGKRLTCAGEKIQLVENKLKKNVLEQFDDSSLKAVPQQQGGGQQGGRQQGGGQKSQYNRAVADTQQKLYNLGFYIGNSGPAGNGVDGFSGPKTKSAETAWKNGDTCEAYNKRMNYPNPPTCKAAESEKPKTPVADKEISVIDPTND